MNTPINAMAIQIKAIDNQVGEQNGSQIATVEGTDGLGRIG